MAEIVGVVLSSTVSLLGAVRKVSTKLEDATERVDKDRSWTLPGLFPLQYLSLMNRIEKHVLPADPPEVKMFMDSFAASFNMIGVAGAIIAQVAITALSLESLKNSHWTAQACFIISLTTGALSVFFACVVHPAINGLDNSDRIKEWLSYPRKLQITDKDIEATVKQLSQSSTYSDPSHFKRDAETILRAQLHKQTSRVASPCAAMMLTAPRQLLSISLSAFLVGLGVYLGVGYTARLITPFGRSGSLAILIIYIIFVIIGLASFYFPQGGKEIEMTMLSSYQDRAVQRALSPEGQLRLAQLVRDRLHSSSFQENTSSTRPSIEVVAHSSDFQSQITHRVAEKSDSCINVVASEHPFSHERKSRDEIKHALADFIAAQEESVRVARRLIQVMEAASLG